MVDSNCLICGSTDRSVHYQGPIRIGRFGTLSDQDHTIWHCNKCSAVWLEGASPNYQSEEYRTLVDGDGSVETFYRTHDAEQAEKLHILGTRDIRGKTVADFGCGGGSFLDLIKGYAAKTLAIEPTQSFHEALRNGGHDVYSYGRDALETWRGRIDIAVCFSVIEHVESPLDLLREIRTLLAPGGVALISTPNRNDWLLDLLPSDYATFFYRQVHRWYFDARSLEQTAYRSGFRRVETKFIHRFDLSNFLLWLRDRKPSGQGGIEVPPVLDAAFTAALEETGRADYLYARLSP